MSCRDRLDLPFRFLSDLSDSELETLLRVASVADEGASIFTGPGALLEGGEAIVLREDLLENIEELHACRTEQSRTAKGALLGGAALGTVGALGGYYLSRRNSGTATVMGILGIGLGFFVGGSVARQA